ncbi:3' terminal RNA ribose 2'-O-methyltransferase Hen1 [Kineococcus sp. LSe6-4]|uniref:Small RNA 2'-O-methyltransferase n=1 Tax=Kineococcus halophytocola TaxID=3234027 RepID=A0ABV4GZH4_9ACTN
MILTLTARRPASGVPAGDLGFLLHKHPDRVHVAEHGAVTTHVLAPVSTPQEHQVAVVLDVDPVALVRAGTGALAGDHVNDRPYAASSLLSVALGRVFATALAGRCTARPELVDVRWPLQVHLPAVPCAGERGAGGAELVRRLFGPLGWTVEATAVPLDETVPSWGDSPYLDLELSGELRLADALAQLYVLLPVLDDAKHYWVGQAEVEKLLRRGGSWLAAHPERDLITRRYLRYSRPLVADALDRLREAEGADPEAAQEAETTTASTPLAVQRREAVLAVLREVGAARVADLGCGQGQLLAALLTDARFTALTGTDVSVRALQQTARRLHLDERHDERVTLFQSSLTYRDERLRGYDAAVLTEVVEHVDPPRLPALERVVFGEAAPTHVLVTTPNAEYNVHYPSLGENGFRHPDHRFEWTRAQFADWAGRVGQRYGYAVRFLGVGETDPVTGAPTQLAVFSRTDAEVAA